MYIESLIFHVVEQQPTTASTSCFNRFHTQFTASYISIRLVVSIIWPPICVVAKRCLGRRRQQLCGLSQWLRRRIEGCWSIPWSGHKGPLGRCQLEGWEVGKVPVFFVLHHHLPEAVLEVHFGGEERACIGAAITKSNQPKVTKSYVNLTSKFLFCINLTMSIGTSPWGRRTILELSSSSVVAYYLTCTILDCFPLGRVHWPLLHHWYWNSLSSDPQEYIKLPWNK